MTFYDEVFVLSFFIKLSGEGVGGALYSLNEHRSARWFGS